MYIFSLHISLYLTSLAYVQIFSVYWERVTDAHDVHWDWNYSRRGSLYP